MDQGCWNISVGDQDSAEIEAIKTTPPLCPQAYWTKDHSIPLPTGRKDALEVKQKEYDEKSVINSFYEKGKATRPSKEGLDDQSVLCSEMENKSIVGAVREGLPFEKRTSCQVILDKGNSQAGRPESLQEVTHEKERQEGGNHASIISGGVFCMVASEKQEEQAVPFQELQPSGKLEDLKSPLLDTEINMQEEQNDTDTDYDGVTSLTELLIQPQILLSEEQQSLGQQQLAKDVAHEVEEQVTLDKMNAVPKEDIHTKVQWFPDTLYQKAGQPVELKYPKGLSIMDKNHKQEQSEVLYHVDLVSEAFYSEAEHNYKKDVDEDVQWPIIRKITSCPLRRTAYEDEQEEGSTNSTSDSPLTEAGADQWIPHQVNIQAVAQENKSTFPLVATCATEEQNLPQKQQEHLQKQHIPLAERVSSTHHHIISHEKESQEGLAHLYSESQGIAFTEETENPGLSISESMGTPPDNISFEKEQQRKLECGDSGSESLYDKEEQDCQLALYLEGQPPLVLEQLSSGWENGTSEAEQCVRKSGTLEVHPLEEQQVEWGDQSKKLLPVSSEEKEAKDDQEEQETTMFPSPQWNAQGQQMEVWHTPKDTFLLHQEHLQRDLGMTCEEQQGLSETGTSCSTRNDEENV